MECGAQDMVTLMSIKAYSFDTVDVHSAEV